MSKNTAVEWLVDELRNHIAQGTLDAIAISKLKMQAKEMEREQIIDAFGVGCQVESTRLIGYQGMAEQYYNETYKGGEQ